MFRYLIHERRRSVKRRWGMLAVLLLTDLALVLGLTYGATRRIFGFSAVRILQLNSLITHIAVALMLAQEIYSALAHDYDHRSDVLSHLIPITGLQAIGAKLLSNLLNAGIALAIDSGALLVLRRLIDPTGLSHIAGVHPQLAKLAGLGGFGLLSVSVAAMIQLGFAIALLFWLQSLRRAHFSRLTAKSLIASGAILLLDGIGFLIVFTFSGLVISLINRILPWLLSLKHLAIVGQGQAASGNGMYLWLCLPVARLIQGNGLFLVTSGLSIVLTIFMLLGAAYLYDERIDY